MNDKPVGFILLICAAFGVMTPEVIASITRQSKGEAKFRFVNGVAQVAADPAPSDLFIFAPADGGGFGAGGESTFCGTFGSAITGTSSMCMYGGTSDAGVTMVRGSGTPTTPSWNVCPNGVDCQSTTLMNMLQANQCYHSTTRPTTLATDQSFCSYFYLGTNPSATPSLVAHNINNGSVVGGLRLAATTTTVSLAAHQDDGEGYGIDIGTTLTASDATCQGDDGWVFVCGTYQRVSGGANNVMRLYCQGAEVASTSTAAAITAGNATTITTGADSSASACTDLSCTCPVNTSGSIQRLALATEALLDAGTISSMWDHLRPRYRYYETDGGISASDITVSRASVAFCPDSTGASLTRVHANVPCIHSGAVASRGGKTNYCLRSAEFDNAYWTKTNVSAVTANTVVGFDLGKSAEALTSTVNGGYVVSNDITITSATGSVTASVYVSHASATQAGAVALYEGVTEKCSATFTATTTWTPASCTASGIDGAAHTYKIRIYPGGTGGTGTIQVMLAQVEDSPFRTPPILTTTATVARAAMSISTARPAGVTDTQGCAAAQVYLDHAPIGGEFAVNTGAATEGLKINSATKGEFHDGTTAATSDAGTAFSGRWATLRAGWKQTYGMTPYLDGTAGSLAAYDNTATAATMYLGSSAGTANHLNGLLKDVRISSHKDGCQ